MSVRILVLEDSEDFRSLLRMTLEFEGYGVTLAANGREGLEAAGSAAYALVLSDIDMPEMDGVEFVRRFRAEHGPETPIIMLSAEKDDVVDRAIAAGATGFIPKPFEPIQLLASVRTHLSAS